MTSEPDSQTFRDGLATIDKRGRRIWVYPIKPRGSLYTARSLVAAGLLLFLVGAPFIRMGGNPLMLLDILGRRFFIFGIGFFPHDFHLLVLGTIALFVFVILFTSAFGRLFCGWACPQTVFLEMVYRRLEFWIEGSGPKQKKLDRAPWGTNKLLRKSAKHGLFLLVSFVLANTLLAWVAGSENVLAWIQGPPSDHPTGFGFVVLFTLVTYGVHARFREQVCTLVCPYGRLQSVLLDPNSIVVAYDFKRGEPRAKLSSKAPPENAGDCIDCAACVHVCPTGIDIRNGTQLECVNCAACIDACNRVMDSAGRPRKLIRYASFNSIANGVPFRFTGRIGGYLVAFAVLATVLGVLTVGRSDVETTVLRTTGSQYEILENGHVRNLYTVKVMNKTSDILDVTLSLIQPEGTLQLVGPALRPAGQQNAQSVFTVEIAPEQLYSVTSTIALQVLVDGEPAERVTTTFNGPPPQ
ncbi:MAG: cytochrome c oxidase accessory protein CcoG [bacterium]